MIPQDSAGALTKLGWTQWFEDRAHSPEHSAVARVAAVDRSRYLLLDGRGYFSAKLAGSFVHEHGHVRDLPCVGDWVFFKGDPGGDFSLIDGVIERKSLLSRKAAGKTVEHQLIAANVDVVVIVQACDYDFNVNRLQRYLVMIEEAGARPCVMLTKTDLVAPAALTSQREAIASAGISSPVIALSNLESDSLDAFKTSLVPGETYCFVGSSGVGKSTIVNRLLGREQLSVGDVSGTGEGRELLVLESGALVIDNPGMRELGLIGADAGLEANYAAILALAPQCRFSNCSHEADSHGCAVQAAIQAGHISQDAADSFFQLRKESEFNDLSYADKRRKDKDFGQFLKTAKKDLRLK